jgi:hypothetical protein
MTFQGVKDMLWEAPVPHGADFRVKNEEIGPENAYFWNINLK